MEDQADFDEEKPASISKIRPELNLEKWSVWQPARSVKKETRILKRVFTRADGIEVTHEVAVGYVDKFGTLTTEDQKIYYGLIKIWENRQRPTSPTLFSLRELARELGKEWGTNVIESLTRSLKRLKRTPISWSHSYYNSLTKETVEILDDFNVLSELQIARTKSNGVVNDARGHFRFNNLILNNLLHNYSKPLLFGTVISFRSEIAQILYTHLDLILADKKRYERRTKELLLDDLGLSGEEYKYPSVRKRVLERALAELRGAQLSTGFIVSAAIEKTRDDNDYKAVFRKGYKPPEVLPETIEEDILLSQQNPDALKAEEIEARLSDLTEEERLSIVQRVTAAILDEYPILKGREKGTLFHNLLELKIKKELDS